RERLLSMSCAGVEGGDGAAGSAPRATGDRRGGPQEKQERDNAGRRIRIVPRIDGSVRLRVTSDRSSGRIRNPFRAWTPGADYCHGGCRFPPRAAPPEAPRDCILARSVAARSRRWEWEENAGAAMAGVCPFLGEEALVFTLDVHYDADYLLLQPRGELDLHS